MKAQGTPIMSSARTHHFESFEPQDSALSKSAVPFAIPGNTPPVLQAMRERARWFHEHPTQSALLMRLEESAHQRKLG